MLGAIQPRAIRPNRIEQQRTLGTILHWVRYHCDWVARLVRHLIPALADHDVDARSLDIPRSDRRGVLCFGTNRDDDMAVWILQLILLHDASIGNILGHVEHRAGMMSLGWTSRKEQDSGDRDQSQNCLCHFH